MSRVEVAVKEQLAVLTLDRREKLNALNAELLGQLEKAFEGAVNNPQVRVIIITGAGEKAFVAGADIGQFPDLTPEQAYEFARRGQELFLKIQRAEEPVIAAVNGYALGGGCELALACHLRYASENARFGQPEVTLGIIAGYGGTQRLPRLVGTGYALDLLLSGRMVDAREAYRMGLVNGVFPAEELLPEVEKVARRIASQGPQALKQTLRAVFQGYNLPMEQALEIEAQAFRDVFATEDRVEGTRAFLEKRKPDFKGK